MASTFKLQEHATAIRGIAKRHECGAAEAVEKFIINLNTFSEHYPGAPEVDYRILGQQWNALSYKDKNKQKRATIEAVAKEVQMLTRRNREA